MGMKLRAILFGLASVSVATPVLAQTARVYQRSFAYFDRTLTVEVAPPGAGTLRLLRAGNGRVEVTARAPNGVAVSGVGGWNRDRLRLDGIADGPIDYVIVVPQNVHVRVQLPDQQYATAAPDAPTAAYSWGRVGRSEPEPEQPDNPGMFLAYASPRAPDEITIDDLASVRRISIRTGAPEFELRTSRELGVTPGTTRRIAIRTAGDPLDILVQIPTATDRFVLRVPNGVAFSLERGTIEVNCAPATSQLLKDGRRWIDITPDAGTLECRAGGRP